MPENVRLDFVLRCVNLLYEINQAKQKGLPIVYEDETLFGKRSLVTREWATKNSNLSVS